MIAINWLIIADHSPSGIWDEDCLTLAELHSAAADYPKTGNPVSKQSIPRIEFRERPDWNASEVHRKGVDTTQYYKSKRWIGRLYREVELPPLPGHNRSRSNQAASDEKRDISAEEVFELLQSFPDDVLTTTLRERMTSVLPDPSGDYLLAEVQAIVDIFKYYVQELLLLCSNYSINYKALEEEEIVAGTISAKTSQPRVRKDFMSQMRERSTDLVMNIRDLLAQGRGEGEDGGVMMHYDDLRRAWIGYTISTVCPGNLGARSFQLIALGQFFESLKAIEDAHSGYARDGY